MESLWRPTMMMFKEFIYPNYSLGYYYVLSYCITPLVTFIDKNYQDLYKRVRSKQSMISYHDQYI